ncbi:MAG: hypothetical protein C7B45_08070 [Sulfobacillus acidophilus]|uniref:Uncharacterized protein n=1 Tax=Sulfobacillus acidophilus TaxID=53633 RepID=A0A2T2WIW6_9FIRM|nr:MAG: hypothetical protein C7B45_08070 [Sulfobacillus acidophilus]
MRSYENADETPGVWFSALAPRSAYTVNWASTPLAPDDATDFGIIAGISWIFDWRLTQSGPKTLLTNPALGSIVPQGANL